jgi:hypothetical protein
MANPHVKLSLDVRSALARGNVRADGLRG